MRICMDSLILCRCCFKLNLIQEDILAGAQRPGGHGRSASADIKNNLFIRLPSLIETDLLEVVAPEAVLVSLDCHVVDLYELTRDGTGEKIRKERSISGRIFPTLIK